MKTANQEPTVHSATVHIELTVNGFVLPVCQLGPNFLVLKTPIEQPPADAIISMSIDGREDRWRVRLPDGIQAGKRKTAISKF
jgi:hypothetical protein